MVESGTLQFNTGIGTKGLEVSSSQLLTSNFQSGFFGRVRMFRSRAGLLLRLRLPTGLPILRWRAAPVFCSMLNVRARFRFRIDLLSLHSCKVAVMQTLLLPSD